MSFRAGGRDVGLELDREMEMKIGDTLDVPFRSSSGTMRRTMSLPRTRPSSARRDTTETAYASISITPLKHISHITINHSAFTYPCPKQLLRQSDIPPIPKPRKDFLRVHLKRLRPRGRLPVPEQIMLCEDEQGVRYALGADEDRARDFEQRETALEEEFSAYALRWTGRGRRES